MVPRTQCASAFSGSMASASPAARVASSVRLARALRVAISAGHGGALRVGLGGQPIRFERLRDLAEGFEVSAANELEVGCGRRALRRPGLCPGGRRRAEGGREGPWEQQRRATRHDVGLFHAASVLTRAVAPARRPHSMKILLVRLRLIGDVVFTTPVIRSVRRRCPMRTWTTSSSRQLRRWFDITRTWTRSSSPREAWLAADHRRRPARPAAAPQPVRRGAGPARWATGIVAHLAQRSPAAHRLRGARATVDVHRRGPAPTGDPSPSLGREPMGHPGTPVAVPAAPDTLGRPRDDGPRAVADPAVEKWMRHEGLEASHDLVVVHVSAGNAFRRWPLLSFVTLADRISAGDANRRIILTSGPSEAAAAAEVVRLVRERRPACPEAVRTCGDMSLDELHALIGRARLYIGGDSGPLHLAATTGTPIVGLYGPTLPVRSAPWRDPQLWSAAVDVGALPCRPCEQRVCAPGDFRCLTHITVDAVVAAAERAFSLPAPAGRAD